MLKVWVGLEAREFLQASAESVGIETSRFTIMELTIV